MRPRPPFQWHGSASLPLMPRAHRLVFVVGSTQIIPNESCTRITSGAIASGMTIAPTPTGIGYHIYVKASSSNNILRDFCTVPITGSSWTLDTLDCPTAGTLPASTVVTSINGNRGAFNLIGGGVSCSVVSGVYTCSVSGSGTGGASLPSTTSLLKGDGAGGAVAATPGTDVAYPPRATWPRQRPLPAKWE